MAGWDWARIHFRLTMYAGALVQSIRISFKYRERTVHALRRLFRVIVANNHFRLPSRPPSSLLHMHSGLALHMVGQCANTN